MQYPDNKAIFGLVALLQSGVPLCALSVELSTSTDDFVQLDNHLALKALMILLLGILDSSG